MEKTALITGASRGIGAATACVLSREGWRVWVNYKNSRVKAEELADRIGAKTVCADVSNMGEVAAMFEATGDVDLLVNNAGIASYGLLADTDELEWNRVIGVNLSGVYNCCKLAISHMVRQKSGVIINISSIWGISGASCEAAYSAAKAGVIGLTRALAMELGPSGIRVNCVAPGVIGTDMLDNLRVEDKNNLADSTPLGRLGTPADVAELIAFLASDRAGFVTGQVIAVDGGFGLAH